MKLYSKIILATGLLMLAACGGAAEENVAANTAGDDLYNVTEDLTLDNGLGNDLGNLGVGNDTGANVTEANNLTDTNTIGNSQ